VSLQIAKAYLSDQLEDFLTLSVPLPHTKTPLCVVHLALKSLAIKLLQFLNDLVFQRERGCTTLIPNKMLQ
jgi:hypothetical protein